MHGRGRSISIPQRGTGAPAVFATLRGRPHPSIRWKAGAGGVGGQLSLQWIADLDSSIYGHTRMKAGSGPFVALLAGVDVILARCGPMVV
jgi:hypothetical protein